MTDELKRFSGMADAFRNIRAPEYKFPSISVPDNRTRTERKEDFEKDLAAIDKSYLISLKDRLEDLEDNPKGNQENILDLKEELDKFLAKFIRYIDTYDELNGAESRKVELKKKELRLEARHDWAEKFRLFFFRVLASALFIVMIFAIGYIEKEYEWATLPLSKYVKPIPDVPAK